MSAAIRVCAMVNVAYDPCGGAKAGLLRSITLASNFNYSGSQNFPVRGEPYA